MGCFAVEQRTKDCMFNATALLKQWNTTSGEKKEITKFFENDNTKEFILALMEAENLHTQKNAYVKSRARADRGGGTWMHPILFVKFAMWLNPRFEVQVIKFVSDQMIAYRNEAGDAYKELSEAVSKIVAPDFMRLAIQNVARGLNYIIFGSHKQAMRNEHGDEKKMKELFEFERQVAMLINDGFLQSYGQTMNYLRAKYVQRHTPKVFNTHK